MSESEEFRASAAACTANAASPAYLARYGVPRSPEDLQRQGHGASSL
jgi:hypothetical protein